MIKLENVNYIYNDGFCDKIYALRDVSIEIPKGKITALIGHTGSGKSTLIQLINGLEMPTSGTVTVDGVDVSNCDLQSLRFKVGVVFQYPEHQLFEETVERDIAFGPQNMGLSKDEISRRVDYAISLVGLDKALLKRSPFELSGGEKRRAAIAGVLAMKPEILILDEPSAGLDPMGRKEMYALIKRLHNEGITIIFISHSMEEVCETADYVAVLEKGQIIMTGNIREVFSQGELLEKSGLEIPQITILCKSLKENGFNLPDGIFTISEAVEHIRRELNA